MGFEGPRASGLRARRTLSRWLSWNVNATFFLFHISFFESLRSRLRPLAAVLLNVDCNELVMCETGRRMRRVRLMI